MKKSDFHRSNRTPIPCMQALDLHVKTTKRAMLTLSFLAEKIKNNLNLRGRSQLLTRNVSLSCKGTAGEAC